jgi:hypothetical protein
MSTTTATTERRRELLRKAREGLEAYTGPDVGSLVAEALAGLKRLEAQLPPRPVSGEEAIEVFVSLIREAGGLLEETGRPAFVMLVHGKLAAKIRLCASAFPQMYLRPDTGPADPRAAGRPTPDGWICTVGGIDVYECPLPTTTEGATP